jgi:short-subunit dehydrogenase
MSTRRAGPNSVDGHVVITGASSGLGAALAQHYAATGARLSLLGRDQARLNSVASICASLGCDATPVRCDVRDAEAMSAVLTQIDDRSSVTLLIASAGIGGKAALSPATGELREIAYELVETNVLGLINTVSPLLPRFVSRRSGHLALVSSIAGYSGLPQAPVYSASKAAVRIYGEGLRRLLRPAGVGVTVVCPGFIDTPMSASLPLSRPFLVPIESAARRVARAIENRSAEVAFPWPLAVASRLDRWLPSAIGDRLMAVVASLNGHR